MSPHPGLSFASLSFVTSQSAAARLVLASVCSEIAEAAAETALTAVVNFAIVAEVLLVLAGLFAALAACMSWKCFCFLAGVNLAYSSGE